MHITVTYFTSVKNEDQCLCTQIEAKIIVREENVACSRLSSNTREEDVASSRLASNTEPSIRRGIFVVLPFLHRPNVVRAVGRQRYLHEALRVRRVHAPRREEHRTCIWAVIISLLAKMIYDQDRL